MIPGRKTADSTAYRTAGTARDRPSASRRTIKTTRSASRPISTSCCCRAAASASARMQDRSVWIVHPWAGPTPAQCAAAALNRRRDLRSLRVPTRTAVVPQRSARRQRDRCGSCRICSTLKPCSKSHAMSSARSARLPASRPSKRPVFSNASISTTASLSTIVINHVNRYDIYVNALAAARSWRRGRGSIVLESRSMN